MNATADRPEFLPPDPGGHAKALGLAVVAHLVLVAALTWGLRWKSSTDTPVAEAELWASVPREAAPRAVEPPPAPPVPRPTPPPPQQAAPQPENADIVRERERKQLEEKKRQEAQEQEARERRQREQKAAQDKQRQQQEQKERAEKERAEKLAADKKREEAQRQQQLKEQQQARQLAELRKANMERIAGLAGASGGPSATGTAAQSAGPSASYGSRVAAKVKPNIVFTEDPAGNPQAEIEVRTAPDGTITSRRLVKSSGIKAWDDAVLRAIDKTETLPRDTDGRVPSVLVISFRPRD